MMSKFEEMSEEEINKLVAEARGFEIEKYFSTNQKAVGGFLYYQRKGETGKYLRDYCNSWADMGPIIETIWDELNDLVVINKKIGAVSTNWMRLSEVVGSKLKAAAIIYLESLETTNE